MPGHIINLAMQVVLSTQSKSEHYNSAEPDAKITVGCDVVGIVRAICVKVTHNLLHVSYY